MGTRLSLFNISALTNCFACMDFIEQEIDDLCLEDVTMVWINLEQWLDQVKCLLSHSSWVNLPEHVEEVISVDDALVDLLIIFLQFGKHLVDFLSQAFLQTFQCHGFNHRQQLIRNLLRSLNQL